MPSDAELIAQIAPMGGELDRRGRKFRLLEGYATGNCPLPTAVVRARVTKAYRMLMSMAQTNYGRRVIKAATSRMQVGGIRSGDDELDQKLWAIWQDNKMDAESRLLHDTVLTHGRGFAIIWPNADDSKIEIQIEDAATVIVEYRPGSRYERVAALRRWVDDNQVPHATLYRPEAVYKFSGPKHASGQAGTQWERRIIPDEDWPVANPFGIVPAVEVTTNRRLKAGQFGGEAWGDFESSTGLLDRINVLEFLRLVIAFTSGFPIRAVIGDKILYDDNGNALEPFKLAADVIAQFENPNVKIEEIKSADLASFGTALDHDVEQLAGVTATPSYFLRSVPIQNVAADAIRAADAPLNGRIEDHKPFISEGEEEILRVAGQMNRDGGKLELPETAQIVWINREHRSLAERADAAVKLASVMPWQAVAELVFDASQDELTRWEGMRASDTIGGLLNPTPTPTQ